MLKYASLPSVVANMWGFFVEWMFYIEEREELSSTVRIIMIEIKKYKELYFPIILQPLK